MAEAYGVSLVWCSQLGLLTHLLCLTAGHRGGLACYNARVAGLLAGAAAVLYYALTFPTITTVAHIAAAATGFALSLLSLPLLYES